MKKSFLHTLSLAIIAMMSISACAPAKVSKEEGLRAFKYPTILPIDLF